MVYASDILAGRATNNSLSAIISEMKTKFQMRRAYRRTVKELSVLTDGELSDLGLYRGVIHETAMKAVYGPSA